MLVKRCIILWLGVIVLALSAQNKPWTWQYRFVAPTLQRDEDVEEKALLFVKTDLPLFTQLLFSWNALRPNRGYYSFYIQVHSKKKNAWGSWHKMADWGSGIQRSYESLSDGICRYVYVRLEVDPGDKADGFRIKAVAHNTAITGLRSILVNISDHTKFFTEHVPKNLYNSVLLEGVSQKSQLVLEHEKNRMMCSPTSCSMLHEYLTRQSNDPLSFAQQAYDNGLRVYGSWPFNMAHAYELGDGKHFFYTTRLASFKALHDILTQGIPVPVSVRGAIVGAPKEYNNGHLLLVIGYNAQTHCVVCHDPAALSNAETLKEYSIDSFIKAWDRSKRLAYIAQPARVEQEGGMK